MREGILGTEVGEAGPLLYQDVKMHISLPHFFHFSCKMLDIGTLLHAGKDKDAVEGMETIESRHLQSARGDKAG